MPKFPFSKEKPETYKPADVPAKLDEHNFWKLDENTKLSFEELRLLIAYEAEGKKQIAPFLCIREKLYIEKTKITKNAKERDSCILNLYVICKNKKGDDVLVQTPIFCQDDSSVVKNSWLETYEVIDNPELIKALANALNIDSSIKIERFNARGFDRISSYQTSFNLTAEELEKVQNPDLYVFNNSAITRQIKYYSIAKSIDPNNFFTRDEAHQFAEVLRRIGELRKRLEKERTVTVTASEQLGNLFSKPTQEPISETFAALNSNIPDSQIQDSQVLTDQDLFSEIKNFDGRSRGEKLVQKLFGFGGHNTKGKKQDYIDKTGGKNESFGN